MPSELPWRATLERGHLAVLLIRHGQTEWNRTRRFLGSTDIPLDEVGRRQAAQLSTGLGMVPDQVYSSPLSRAWETATAVHGDPQRVDGLRELHQGELEGLELGDAVTRFPDFFQAWSKDPGSVRTPGGEGMAEVQGRVRESLLEITVPHRGPGVIAVVSHQLAIASALCWITGSPLASWRAHRLENCGISLLEFNGKTFTIQQHGLLVGNLGILTGSSLPDV